MKKIIAKVSLVDTCKNHSTLIVSENESGLYGYRLCGTTSRIPFATEGLGCTLPLPFVSHDYINTQKMIRELRKSIESSSERIEELKVY